MKVANRPATRRRLGFTVTAESLMEEAKRREMGARIRELRERSPWKQHHMADKVGVGLRMWQRIEQRGTTEWERVIQIAEIHGVDPYWIWEGRGEQPRPDVLETLSGGNDQEQLDRIEASLKRLERNQAEFLSQFEAAAAQQELPDDDERPAQASQRSARRKGARGTGAKAR